MFLTPLSNRIKVMKFQFSAGGIVYKKNEGQTLILVAKHSAHHGWVFPKGLIGDKVAGEKKEITAIREVKEETGIEAQIERQLAPATYWFKFEGETIKKTVYYFIMKAIGGNTSDHDMEMEKVEWLPKDEVGKRLTYKSDQEVWKEAEKQIT